MVVCLTSARFNMKADILRQSAETETPEGEWVISHDPDSNEIIRVWEPNDNAEPNPDSQLTTFKCIARGIVTTGLNAQGTGEKFGELYDASDFVRINFPPNVRLTRRDRVTNIRDAKGNIIWVEEERTDGAPTIFQVMGVTPVLDPFGKHIENSALLERAETQ